MFEKESDEYSNNWKINKNIDLNFAELVELRAVIYKAHKDGVEFGYNKGYHDAEKHYMNVIDSQHKLLDESKKVNEWHYNGIPHDNKPYLCKVKHPTIYDESEYEILFFDDKEMSWFRWLTLWSGEEGNETARINRKVLAWKEIIPPKERE